MLGFDVFGRLIGIQRVEGGWRVVYFGDDGKHREARDVTIPPTVKKPDLTGYLANVFHEHASPENPDVVRLGPDDAAG